MMQFWFLSILANLAAASALTADYLGERIPRLNPVTDLLRRPRARLVAGYAALIVGFFKLLIVATPEDVLVVGDLLPALAGLALGFSLLFDRYKGRTRLPASTIATIEKAVLTWRIPLGITGMVLAVLHFFLPNTLLL